nr:probable gluconokinase [Cavia porcellus]
MAAPSALLVMGVSGAGKSTVGAMLASELGWKFYDADDYHPEENRAKMRKGIPLSDQDRIPWLCHLHDVLLRDTASGQRVVLACSALKKMYRDILTRGKDSAPPKYGGSKEEKPAEVQLLVIHKGGSFKAISGRYKRLNCNSGYRFASNTTQSSIFFQRPAQDDCKLFPIAFAGVHIPSFAQRSEEKPHISDAGDNC